MLLSREGNKDSVVLTSSEYETSPAVNSSCPPAICNAGQHVSDAVASSGHFPARHQLRFVYWVTGQPPGSADMPAPAACPATARIPATIIGEPAEDHDQAAAAFTGPEFPDRADDVPGNKDHGNNQKEGQEDLTHDHPPEARAGRGYGG